MLKSLGIVPIAGLFLGFKTKDFYKSSQDLKEESNADVLVIGGGTAGVIAAIQAARLGSKTVLIENNSQLGGTMTTGGVCFPGLFHAWGKQIIKGIGWELIAEAVALNSDRMPDFSSPNAQNHSREQILINPYLYSLLAEEKCIEAGVDLRYYETPRNISRKDGYWYVDIIGKGTSYRIKAKQIVDCTGNAIAASMAGYSRIKDKESQPGSLIFELGGYDLKSLDKNVITQLYNEAISKGTLLKTDAYNGAFPLLNVKKGLATQHVLGADSSTSKLHSLANVNGRTSLLRILRFVRSLPGCEHAYIRNMSSETAIRETYRIDGMYQITQDDYISGKVHYDSLALSYYPIDLHVQHGVSPRPLKEGVVATIPLRSLIPKGSSNFMVAGRCISSDRLANSALRVQASCMAMGQIAGVVSSLSNQMGCEPKDVPLAKIRSVLEEHDAIIS